MKTFLKKLDLQLVNGGYLTSSAGKPVNNKQFVKAQNHAHFIVSFAKAIKGKDIKGKEAVSVEEIRKEVYAELFEAQEIQFVKKPKEVKRPLNKQLADEALSFVKFQEDSDRANKVNKFLQKFAILKEFEEYGLFFKEDIVKLNELYTLKQVVDSVNEVIDLL
jgi:hypothetical protein